ncbi:MAG: quinolinate synthase [Gemmatimonadetes bacterium]|nr:quinolinate synthase [Gemmatimonadota bacterium]
MHPIFLRPQEDSDVNIGQAIDDLKDKMNATVMAHYYQDIEVQDVADFIGDSLQLARYAAESKADVIVFCGVHFMAESAKILAPEKLVLLPDMDAGCSLADSAPADEFEKFVRDNPDHTVVTYVNSSAAVKALSDFCCTSSNAVEVINSIPIDQPIIFGPDRFLGDWVERETGRKMLLWQGSCEIHELFSEQKIAQLQEEYPNAVTLVHPECPEAVRAIGDVVGSTKKLLDAVKIAEDGREYIVVTEPGIIHQMKQVKPNSKYIMAPAEVSGSDQGACTSCNTCPHMRLNTLQKLYKCMVNSEPSINLDYNLIERARLPIERMLAIG